MEKQRNVQLNEIRIGNWFIDYDGKPYQWTINEFLLLSQNALEFDELIKQPIKLSPAILESCGFVNVGSLWVSRYFEPLYLSFTGIEWWKVEMKHEILSAIRYLHELQNWYYIKSGRELRFNPSNIKQ